MVRQKGQYVGGGKEKARRPRGQKEQRRCRDKAGGQTVPDPAKRYRSLDFNGIPI